jgi:diguanylate cyclase (GGDEF)-like protein
MNSRETITSDLQTRSAAPWRGAATEAAIGSESFGTRESPARTDHFSAMSEEDITAEVFQTPPVRETDREAAYDHELLGLFRQRLRFNALVGIALLPLFQFFYYLLSPTIAAQTFMIHAMMLGVCLLYLLLPSHIHKLMWARLLTVFGYTLICLGASLVMITLSQNQFGTLSVAGVQLAMLAAHSQILISIVLLPLTLYEGLVMTAIVTFCLAWSSWWTVPIEKDSVQSSQLFVLTTTAIFVLSVVHFQAVLRRRAFDASFDLARSVAQLQLLSTLDAVTGGFNRLYLQRVLAHEISRAARFSHPLSALMFDLDNFKAVNDTQGHTIGDKVLRVVNEAAVLAVREVDTVARYGGDEFMVVLPETKRDDALEIAERMQQCVQEKLQEHFGADSGPNRVTLSIGITTLRPNEKHTPENIISLADERLYEAKRMGKDRIAV